MKFTVTLEVEVENATTESEARKAAYDLAATLNQAPKKRRGRKGAESPAAVASVVGISVQGEEKAEVNWPHPANWYGKNGEKHPVVKEYLDAMEIQPGDVIEAARKKGKDLVLDDAGNPIPIARINEDGVMVGMPNKKPMPKPNTISVMGAE